MSVGEQHPFRREKAAERENFLQAGGEMGSRMRAFNWLAHPLGPPDKWPQALKTSARLMLTTNHPVFIFWGPEHFCFYNDAYRASIGAEKHPAMLGAKGRDMWSEIWPIIGPQIGQVMAGEGATWHEDHLVPIIRHGKLDEVYWTYSYSPIDSEGGVGGVLVICTETTERVLADRRRSAEQARLQQMFQQAPGFMAMLRGPEHRFEMVNAAYLRLVGHREVIGKTVAEALPEAIVQGYIDLLDGVYRSGEAYASAGAKYVVPVSPNGPSEERYVDFVYQPVSDATGAVTGIFVEGYDVTGRMRADKALRESEIRYRSLIEAIDEAFMIIEQLPRDAGGRRDYRYIMMNQAAMKMFGTGDLTGQTIRQHFQHEDEEWYDIYDDVVETGKSIRFERESVPQGMTIEMFLSRIEDSSAKRLMVVIQNVTARKRQETALRELNETLERRVAEALAERNVLADIVEGTDAFVQVADLDFRWLAINRAAANEFERIFGVRPKVGDSMLDALARQPAHQAAIKAVWGRALAGEEFTEIGEFGDASRDRRLYEMKYNTLKGPDGRRIGAYQFVYDVTERLREQQRLKEAEEQLRQTQKLEAIGQLTGGVAHDFNNLLMVISGGLTMLGRAQDDAKRDMLMTRMREAVDRGATLTKQLLAFSRRHELKPERLQLHDYFSAINDLLNRSLGVNVRVRIEVPDDVLPVHADPNALQLAILNLAVNARDAMPEGGTVTITARNGSPDNPQAPFVSITVSDTGTGMMPEIRAKIFEPFFTTKEIGKGSGLGLAQVHGFAQQSGGQVTVDSELGRGTTFTLVLPQSNAEAAPPGEHPAPFRAKPGKRNAGNVLLVEDNHEVAALTTEMLEHIGWQVTRVGSAEAALGALANGRDINLIFSDVMMPGGQNGIELARAIRERHPGLPVVLASGYSEAVRAEADQAGLPLLPKPFNLDTLAAIIEVAQLSAKTAPS